MKRLLITIAAAALLCTAMVGVLGLHREWERIGTAYSSSAKRKNQVDEIRIDRDYDDFYEIGTFQTNLPILFIETGEGMINGDEPIMARLSIINAEDDGTPHTPADRPDITLNISIKRRGASSRNFDKSQYRIKFYKDAMGDRVYSYDLLGMGKAAEWVLNGPFLDKTLARNYLAYRLAGEIMDWSPDCRYFELYVNGCYQGVYLAIEPVTDGESRLHLSKFGLLSGETAYIVSRDRVGTDTAPLQNYGKTAGYTSHDLYIQYPGKGKITDSEYAWIEEDISRFERVLYAGDYRDPVRGYAAYIDMDNFVDYYLFNEIFMNHDAGLLSTYVYKHMGGKLRIAPWDYNNAFDNYQTFREDFDVFYLTKSPWFDRLLNDRAFVDRLVARYRELRESTFSERHMFEMLDGTKALLGGAVDRNFKIWDFTFHINLLPGSGRDLESYDEAMAQLKNAITERLGFLDGHLTDLYQYCA